MNTCENCNNKHDGKYGSGRFCTSKCARGFSTKNKRKEINKKVSKTLSTSLIKKICINCNNEFHIKQYKHKQNFCSNKCFGLYRWKNNKYREHMTNIVKKRCNNIKERIRLRNIGRLGGFGTKGTTSNGIKYQSILEKECFEYLENNNINFIPHKHIPNSSKVSDIYLNDGDMWIELDGIDREKRKKWLGKHYTYWINKLNIYKKEKLNLKIFKTSKEFISFMENI